MRKLVPAQVSYWDDFLILYRIYMMTGSFHILLFKGTVHFMLIKCHAVQNRKHYACATCSSLPADRFLSKMGGRFAFT